VQEKASLRLQYICAMPGNQARVHGEKRRVFNGDLSDFP
jgi:hypothetical protein